MIATQEIEHMLDELQVKLSKNDIPDLEFVGKIIAKSIPNPAIKKVETLNNSQLFNAEKTLTHIHEQTLPILEKVRSAHTRETSEGTYLDTTYLHDDDREGILIGIAGALILADLVTSSLDEAQENE